VLAVVVDTITQALGLPYVAIELKRGDGFEPAAAYGQPADELLRLPLTYQGETIGRLVLAPRGPKVFTLADRLLLEDLARQAGVAIYAAWLRADSQRS
jgi:two-component system NarL family sensor kinase